MKKPRAVVVGRHMYGFGGGAVAQLALAEGLQQLDYDVMVYSPMAFDPAMLRRLGQSGIGTAAHYLGCAKYADVLVNVDHFTYEPPLAKLNLAHVFHPHTTNRPSPEFAKAYRWSANSAFTSHWVQEEWGITAPGLYVPIARGYAPALKGQTILHVSRFTRPSDLSDKGHTNMLSAFRTLYEAGAEDWELVLAGSVEDGNYLQQLQAQARGLPVRFIANPPDKVMRELYATAAFYWHATGASLPGIHGAQEHLGLTTIEAMASGAVPVVLGTGGQPEIITENVTGRLCQNTYTMAALTLRLIENQSRWAQLSQAAQAAAQPWMDWNAWLERLAAWLEDKAIPALPASKTHTSQFKSSDVCIVIPTRHNYAVLNDCLRSLSKNTPPDVEVIVIDNSDADNEEALADPDSNVTVLHQDIPLNFAQANALAATKTKRSILVAMNDDVVLIDPHWLEVMLDELHAGVGVVGAKLLYPSGKLQHAGGAIDWNRPDIGYHRWYGLPDHPAANQTTDVLFVTGALLLARRECWRWPNWSGWGYEDTDLCLSAISDGWRVVYQPAARAIHYEGVSRAQLASNAVATATNRDLFHTKWCRRYYDLPFSSRSL